MNPEFRRNLWLELSLPRLLLTPLLLGIGFAAIGWGGDAQAIGRVSSTAWWLFWAFALVWGGRRAAASVAEELSDGTWHGQRMSSLGAWSMTWGKLIGATSFAWYGALICLAVHLAAWRLDMASGCSGFQRLADRDHCLAQHARFFGQPALMIASAIGTQAAAMALMLARHVQNPLAGRLGTVLAHLVGPAVLLMALGLAPSPLPSAISRLSWGLLNGVRQTHGVVSASGSFVALPMPPPWFGHDGLGEILACAMIGLLAGGALLAAYRCMRAALQYRSLPWAYLLVSAALVVYLAGFRVALELTFPLAGLHITSGVGAIFAALVCVYPALLLARKDSVLLTRLGNAVHTGHWRQAAILVPEWSVVLAAAAIAGATVAALGAPVGAVSILAAAFAFVLRDTAVVYWWSLGARTQRSDLSAIVTLAVLYGLLPGIAFATGARQALPLLVPAPLLGTTAMISIAVAEAALAWFLVYRRWRAFRPAVSPA